MSEPCPVIPITLGILQRLADGDVAKVIAGDMACSHQAIHDRLHRAMVKLGIKTKTQLVAHCIRQGWIS